MKFSDLYDKATVNPINGKARTLPFFNLTDKHTLNFHLSWIGFFVAFFSWFGFPPLLDTIQTDLKISKADVLNSNVLGLTSTLFVRAVSGTLCDWYGPRKVMAMLLLLGAIPTAFVPFVTNASGLLAIRFFIGILGGTFVPCQVWTTAFFDKNIVGTANAIAGGWGNAGGGAIFYAIPAVMTSLMDKQGLSISSAWKTSFLVLPLILLVTVAIAILVLGSDCPQGKWENRYVAPAEEVPLNRSSVTLSDTMSSDNTAAAFTPSPKPDELKAILKIVLSPQTMLVALPYLCTFGAELAVEGIISRLYASQSHLTGLNWDEPLAGKYASIFGLLNIVTRPLGGAISDYLYKSRPVYIKKYWLLFLGIMEGALFIVVGLLPNMNVFQLIGVLSCVAVAMEMGNGANYALVPHIFPRRNGFVSGITGACGNLGGIIFSLIFRYNPTNTFKAMWICGIIVLVLHSLVLFVNVPESSEEPVDTDEKKVPVMVEI